MFKKAEENAKKTAAIIAEDKAKQMVLGLIHKLVPNQNNCNNTQTNNTQTNNTQINHNNQKVKINNYGEEKINYINDDKMKIMFVDPKLCYTT